MQKLRMAYGKGDQSPAREKISSGRRPVFNFGRLPKFLQPSRTNDSIPNKPACEQLKA